MSLKDEALIELQKRWYKKLKDKGFIDIETIHGTMKDWPSVRLRRDYSLERFKEKQAYFQIASQLLWEHTFQNKGEKKIWKLHTEGLSLREISRTVRTPQNKMNKDKIKIIVRKISKFVYSRMLDDQE